MGNFFTDNEDIQFNLNQLDLAHIAAIVEEGFRFSGEFPDAPSDAEEAIDKYNRLLTELGGIAADEIAPTATETDEVGNILNDDNTVTYTPGVVKALRLLSEAGLMGSTLPYRFGGLNCPMVFLTATNDIVSRADASLMNLYGLQGIGETINAFADEEIKKQYVPELASGRMAGAMVLTEPEAGSDLQSVKVKAWQNDKGDWFIKGVKRFITNGCGDVLLVMARSEPEITNGRGLSLFLVEKGPKVRIRRLENKLGIHGSPTCELEFQDAPGKLIGERQQGLIKYVMALMYGARLGIAAQSCGIAEAAFRTARAYAHTRRQFGTEIENFPAVQELLVEMSVDLAAARALTYYTSYCMDIQNGAARQLESGRFADEDEKKRLKSETRVYKKFAGMLTPMCKYFASEMCMRVANHAVSVMGGSGYMHDYPLERHLRDSRITTIYEGTTQLQIVPAVSAVCSGIADSLIKELLDRDWPAEIRPMVDELREGAKALAEVVDFVKEEPDANYRRLNARKIVDMAVFLIIGVLLCDHATSSQQRKTIARYWLDTRMPELRRNHQQVLSGDRLILTDFEILAGAAPVMAKA